MQVIRLAKLMLIRIGARMPTPAFLHIPKTGGTYLSQQESNHIPVISPFKYLGHQWVVQSLKRSDPVFPPQGYRRQYVIEKRALSPYFVFTTIRNPFSFLVSYLWHAGGLNPKYHDPNHYDFNNARKGFDYLLKTIINRTEPWPSQKFIHGQMFCDDGDLIVDWINHNESLDDDLSRMANRLNIVFNRRQPQRVGRTDDYRSYYTDELADLVNTTWKRELRLFGYDFFGKSVDRPLLGGEVTIQQKNCIKYFWESDELLIDGASYRANRVSFEDTPGDVA